MIPTVVAAMAAASAVAAAPPKPPAPKRQGRTAGTKRAWFAKLQGMLAAPQPVCLRCCFDNGEWLGYVPSTHACGKENR